ncbi:MAG TPA: hypothetical protein VIM16_07270 [Mucilaginibacter sp.]|jgi:hypothetical protein
MKHFILTGLFCLLTIITFAQATNDSLAYQLERARINAMLAKRQVKFDQYNESLSMHTGIFGSQSKNDIQSSSDILMNIVKTDDSVYSELKILFEYAIFQRVQVQNQRKEIEKKNLVFVTTIKKLRKQVQQLKADAAIQQQKYQKTKNMFIIGLILMFVLILYLFSWKRKIKTSTPPGGA